MQVGASHPARCHRGDLVYKILDSRHCWWPASPQRSSRTGAAGPGGRPSQFEGRHAGRAARALVTSGYPEAPSEPVALLTDPANSVQLEAIDGLAALARWPAPKPAIPFRAVRGSIAWSDLEAGPMAVMPRTWRQRRSRICCRAARRRHARA